MTIEPHHSNKALQEIIDKLTALSGNSNHENLQGLLGGNSSGHYHVTVDLLNKLINLPANGGDGGGTSHNSIYRLVRKFFPYGQALQTITIPAGVKEILVSGCAAGGGLFHDKDNYNISDDAEVSFGCSGEQCFSVPISVNQGNSVTCSPGLGGMPVVLPNGGNKMDGDDAVLYVNGLETLKLKGGYGGDKNAQSCYGYNLSSTPDTGLFIPPSHQDANIIAMLLNQWLIGQRTSEKELGSRILSLLEMLAIPQSRFHPYGSASFSSSQRGGDGLFIIEYLEMINP